MIACRDGASERIRIKQETKSVAALSQSGEDLQSQIDYGHPWRALSVDNLVPERWQQREACAGHKLMPVSENGTEGVMSDGDLNGDELGGS